MPSDGTNCIDDYVAPTLLPCKLELERMSLYNPQRKLHQLGYDQRVVRSTGDMSYSRALVRKNKFLAYSSMQILAGKKRLFFPPLRHTGLCYKGH